MTTLYLPLKKKWFEMIKAGTKLEEYRKINEYWASRLIGKDKFDKWDSLYRKCDFSFLGFESFRYSSNLKFVDFDTLVFTLGYPKAEDTRRRLVLKNPKIRIGTGYPEWGAEPGNQYFVITWEA